MAEVVPVDQFLEVVSGVEAGTHRQPVAADEVRAVHEGRRGQVLVRRLPLAAWVLAAGLHVRHRRRLVRPSSPPTSCRSHPPAGSCSGWADRSSTRARSPSRRSGRSATERPGSSKNMPRFLQNFDAIWDERKWELELGLGYFESYDFAGKSLAELGQFMRDAWTFQSRAWEIHFEIMYPLLAIYLQLYGRVRRERDRPRQRSPRCCRAATPRSWRPTARCGTSPTRPSGSSITAHLHEQRTRPTIRAALDRRRRQRLGLADQVRRLPGALRAAHRGHRRHEHPVVERGPDVAARTDPQLHRHGRPPRLRQVPRIARTSRARRGDRRRPLEVAQRRRARRVQRAAGDQQRRQLRVVERGPQLLHRPARLDPDAHGRAGDRGGGRRRHVRRRAVPVLPRAEEVCARSKQWKDLQSIATARHEYYDHYQ